MIAVWLALAGTVFAAGTLPGPPARLDRYPGFKSHWVAAREVDVWLPPGYGRTPRRYPVIYMQDGQNLFDPATSYAGVSWSVDQAMMRLIAAGQTHGAIIVGIWNTPARFAEYLPQDAALPDPVPLAVTGFKPLPRSAVQSNAYLRFMVRELKPFVDRTYRTEPGRRHTFVMGSSMGGLIAAYAVVKYPRVFGGAACLSTHWPVANGVVIPYLAHHLPPPSTGHRFYFDHGTRTLDAGYGPYQQRMDAAMRAAGYRPGPLWMSRVFPGAEHSEKSWSKRVGIPLAFLLRGTE